MSKLYIHRNRDINVDVVQQSVAKTEIFVARCVIGPPDKDKASLGAESAKP
ncbi:unnamed protein product [Acidithrix sp. C25]|nr:unnamed protein product [Acidithrix sp. C25]